VKPRVCIVGPLVGGHAGRVTTQGEKLRDVLVAAGYPVIAVSTSENRYVRVADIAATIARARSRIDVMIVFTYSYKAFIAADVATMLGRVFRIPIVLAMCGGAIPQFMTEWPAWTARVFRRATKIVCQSPYLARALEGRGLTVQIIPNVFDVARYRHASRARARPRLFWMRTFEDLYNPQLALRTFARVRERFGDATLVLAGQDTGHQHTVEAEARRMNLPVRFAGFLDLAGKQREGDAADIFLNTPRIDNRPICVVEAAALGLPVVSTNVGGIPDLLEHEVTGLLVPDDDDRAMADAVIRLVDEPALVERLSKNGAVLAQRSAISNVLPQWDRLLAEVS
jgi:glycosyltransferase involved in cell wall biosynthesis